MNEFNRSANEFPPQPEESVLQPDNSQPKEEGAAPEWGSAPEFPEKRLEIKEKKPQNPKKRSSQRSFSPVTCVVAAASVVVIAAAGGLLPSRAQAAIVSSGSTDTAISFDVNVEEDAGELSAVVYNDFTRRVFPLAEGSNSLTAGDLTPGMRYTVAVVKPSALGEMTVDQRTVETSATPPVTEWLGIEHECTCNVDGYFHFTMDFRDENNWWSDFRATLTDAEGHVSECVFTGDLHGDQRIDVAIRAGLTGSTVTFTVTCRTSDPSAPGELILYTAQVKI